MFGAGLSGRTGDSARTLDPGHSPQGAAWLFASAAGDGAVTAPAAVWAALVLAFSGCYSTPRPPPPGPRVTEISDRGRLKFVRDGRVIDARTFGGGLLEAVRGNPDAERAAKTYARRNAAGRWIMTASAAVVLTAILAFRNPDSETVLETPGLVIVGASAVCFWSGLRLHRSAQTYRHDAINIYNASVEQATSPTAKAQPAK